MFWFLLFNFFIYSSSAEPNVLKIRAYIWTYIHFSSTVPYSHSCNTFLLNILFPGLPLSYLKTLLIYVGIVCLFPLGAGGGFKSFAVNIFITSYTYIFTMGHLKVYYFISLDYTLSLEFIFFKHWITTGRQKDESGAQLGVHTSSYVVHFTENLHFE